MSFTESIIIPYDLFKKCNIEKESKSILQNDSLPLSEKLLLYDQNKLKSRSLNQTSLISDQKLDNEIKESHEDILIHIPKRYRPYTSSILRIIDENPDIISYDKSFNVYIKGQYLPNSNIIKIFQDFMKSTIITKETDFAEGGKAVYSTLTNDLNVPKEWFPATKSFTKKRVLPIRAVASKERRADTDNEQNRDMYWIDY